MISVKKVLITGGAGFIGSHLAKRLLDEGNEVTVIDNFFTGTKDNIADLIENSKFTFLIHDVTNSFSGQFDEIYNLACPASPIHYQKNPVETTKTAFLGLMNMLDLALRTKAKVLHASTSEIYGDPKQHPQKETYWGNVNTVGPRSCYDEGKRIGETLCSDYYKEFGVDVRVLRIFNTYGPNMQPNDGRVVSNFILQALENKDLTIYGKGTQTRSFQYVDDLIDLMVLYMKNSKEILSKKFKKINWNGIPIINAGNPNEFTIKNLATEVLRLIDNSKSKLVFKELPIDDPKQRQPDITMAKTLFNWNPKVQLELGLKKTIKYFENNNK